MKYRGNLTDYRCDLKQRILDVAMPVFKRRGVKSVRMDEIASMLSISKRTLYEIYDDKETLLLAGIRRNTESLESHIDTFAATAGNEMEILIEYLRIHMRDLRDVSPAYLLDVRRYKRVVEYMRSHNAEQRVRSMAFISHGVEHGYFVSNFKYDLFVDIVDAVMRHIMSTRMYEKYPLNEIMHALAMILFRGCCTEKGRQILDRAL